MVFPAIRLLKNSARRLIDRYARTRVWNRCGIKLVISVSAYIIAHRGAVSLKHSIQKLVTHFFLRFSHPS